MKKRILAVVLAVALVASLGILAVFAGNIPAVTERKTGVTVYQNTKAAVDASNLAEGYLLISYTGGKQVRTRVQIAKTGGVGYLYELKNDGTVETFPLTEGDGDYTIKVYENVGGNKYATAYSCSVTMKLRDPFLPFLYPNQFVNFTEHSNVVKTAKTITKNSKTDLEKVTAVFDYVVDNFTYDYELAKNVKSGYVPVVDAVLKSKKGICFDYAAVMASMLRSQKIPCKLVVGYAGEVYHAWINVYIQGEGWVDKAIYFDGKSWSLMDPTFVSSGKRSDQIMKYVTTEKNYTQKFAY
ncbi:MAG: transglutaminase-like domain-containing protein [Oscillibacter sp.]